MKSAYISELVGTVEALTKGMARIIDLGGNACSGALFLRLKRVFDISSVDSRETRYFFSDLPTINTIRTKSGHGVPSGDDSRTSYFTSSLGRESLRSGWSSFESSKPSERNSCRVFHAIYDTIAVLDRSSIKRAPSCSITSWYSTRHGKTDSKMVAPRPRLRRRPRRPGNLQTVV